MMEHMHVVRMALAFDGRHRVENVIVNWEVGRFCSTEVGQAFDHFVSTDLRDILGNNYGEWCNSETN